jgi:hypothetical protein
MFFIEERKRLRIKSKMTAIATARMRSGATESEGVIFFDVGARHISHRKMKYVQLNLLCRANPQIRFLLPSKSHALASSIYP